MAEVVALHGGPVADTREPDVHLVERLEWLLEAARSGEIQGAMIAYAFADGSSGEAAAGVVTYALVGRIEALKLSAIEGLRS